MISLNMQYQVDGVSLQDANSVWNLLIVLIWYMPAIIAAPFIVAYSPLTKLKRLGWVRFLATNSVLILGSTLALQIAAMIILYFFFDRSWGTDSVFSMIGYFYRSTPWHADILLIFGLFAMGYSLDYSQKLRQAEIKSLKLQTELVNAELQALKSQLNPHFLFNVLNGISGLIRSERNIEATDSLSDLSAMLRTILENRNQEMVTVKNELEFIESYLALQQMRFRDKLTVNINASEEVLQVKIPFMVLQPLVENAIHHGCTMERDGNIVSIVMTKVENNLLFTLTNRVPEHSLEGGFGIGIGNNKERLEKIYGDQFELTLRELPERYFETTLLIPHGETNE